MTQLATLGAVVNAERIKLTTVRSPLWSTAVAAVLSFAIAALQASAAYEYDLLTPTRVSLGVAVFGVPVLMIVAAMTVTGEYRTALVRTTFMATPDRTLVLAAKAVVAAVFSGVVAATMVIGSILVARLAADPPSGELLAPTEPEVWRTIAAFALYAMLAAVLGVGVAVLVRHTAGAVTTLLLWPLLVEPLLANLPGRGPQIGPYLPFNNAMRFLEVQWLFPDYGWHWGPFGSLVYFTAVVAAVFGAAILAVNRRDA